MSCGRSRLDAGTLGRDFRAQRLVTFGYGSHIKHYAIVVPPLRYAHRLTIRDLALFGCQIEAAKPGLALIRENAAPDTVEANPPQSHDAL